MRRTIEGFLKEINGKYKLRVTELTLAPGGHVGEHNHVGPGIRQVTSGYMTYVLPKETIVYGPGDFFFESGDINHTVFNRTEDADGARAVRNTAGGPERTIVDSGQAPLITAFDKATGNLHANGRHRKRHAPQQIAMPASYRGRSGQPRARARDRKL